MKPFHSLIFIGLLCLISCKNQTTKEKLILDVQSKLDSLTLAKIIPGVTFAVRYGDYSELTWASGYSDVENKIAMKPNDIMFSGSVGKTYVAAVVLKLYEQGLIDLKAKAIDYLKGEDWFWKVPNAKEITIEMLLNHTAGVPEYVYEQGIWQIIKANPDKAWSAEERLTYTFKQNPTNKPGSGWNYADSHYIILGLILEKVTGKDYYTILDELIIKPFMLKNTYHANIRDINGLVVGYTNLSDVLLLPAKVFNEGKYAFNPQLEWTGGGLASNVSDLTKWAKQLYGGDVLKPESKALMFTPAPYRTSLFEEAKYGLGCFIGETDGITYYGHTGFVPGYLTYLQYIPQYDIALAFQFNNDASHENFSMKSYFNTIKKVVIQDFINTKTKK